MKKFLPKTKTNSSGFTLIELLVVIAIIAILAIIGITLFSTAQKRARDAKRISDITAMSKAEEVNYVAGIGYPTALSATYFADQAIPANPSPGGQTYNTGAPAQTTSTYTFCAQLETSIGNATNSDGAGIGGTNQIFFCKKNSQ